MKKGIGGVVCFLLCLALGMGALPQANTALAKKNDEEMKPYPECKGPKKRIAVYRFKDGVNNKYSREIKNGLYEALQYELQQTGCFVVLVSNEDLGDAASEIGHGQSGMSKESHTPKAGGQLGAQLIVQGTLYEVAYTGGKGANIGFGGNKSTKGIGGKLGVSKQDAKVVIMVKMFDPESRILKYSEKAKGEVTKRKISAGASKDGAVVGGKLNKETPLGDAALKAIHDSVYIILNQANQMPWQTVVLKVSGNRAIIRGGKDVGLTKGEKLDVYQPGEKIEDPETGEVLQLPPQKLGQVQVSQLMSKMAYCNILSGPVQRGMWIRKSKSETKTESK